MHRICAFVTQGPNACKTQVQAIPVKPTFPSLFSRLFWFSLFFSIYPVNFLRMRDSRLTVADVVWLPISKLYKAS